MLKSALLIAAAVGLSASLTACGDQGYTASSANGRVGSNGTALDAASNNGSTSSSYEAQRQKVDNYNGYQPGYR